MLDRDGQAQDISDQRLAHLLQRRPINNMFGLSRRRSAIRLYWWRHRDPNLRNFGDELSPLVVERIAGRRVEWSDVENCDLVAIGSVLERFQAAPRRRPVHIWGSGFIRDGDVRHPGKSRVAALRGPLTAQRFQLPGIPTGDPGLLCHVLLERRPRTRFGLGLIPHYVDLDERVVDSYRETEGPHTVISPLLPPETFITRVAECEVIVSSCLHGLITADALGVPNAWTEFSDRVVGAGYKFRDYFGNYGIREVDPLRLPVASHYSADLHEAISTAWERPGIAEIQERLITSFPVR